MHVCLLGVVIVQLDVDIHGDPLPNVYDQIYRALDQVRPHLLQVLDLNSIELERLTPRNNLDDLFCLHSDFITANDLVHLASHLCEGFCLIPVRETSLDDELLHLFK